MFNNLNSQLSSTLLSFAPLAALARGLARKRIIKRARSLGVDWHGQVQKLPLSKWKENFTQIRNPDINYPSYYTKSFHSYERGNLCWESAIEQEIATQMLSYQTFSEAPGVKGDTKLRQNYHDFLKAQITKVPRDILDLGCGVGLSTFAIQEAYPNAKVIGLDMSPYFLSVAHHNAFTRNFRQINWIHGDAESTGLPDTSFDLISAFFMLHELPREVTMKILREAYRLLRPNGHFAFMDINPKAKFFSKMSLDLWLLFKSGEPWLDEYLTLDVEQTMVGAGFTAPKVA